MQLRAICKSKIHHATITETNLLYIGSIAIDSDLLERSDIQVGEKVHVWNLTNGHRFDTYALSAPAKSGQILVNGASARLCYPGDRIIIVAFVLTDEVITPRMVLVDEQNQFVEWLRDNRFPDTPIEQFTAPAREE